MHNSSQVIVRNAQAFGDGEGLLFFNPPADDLLREFPNARAFTQNLSVFNYLNKRFPGRVEWGVIPGNETALQDVVLFMPKSRELFTMLLQLISSDRDSEGSLWLVGEKKGGVESGGKALKKQFGNASKLDSARHCQLWHCTLPASTEAFALADWVLETELTLPLPEGKAQPVTLMSLPGVFSHGRLDKGTAVLLGQLTQVPDGRVLDFGCGCGVLGLALALFPGKRFVEMVDVDALAVWSANATFAVNGADGKAYGSDGLSDVHGRYAAVFTNPPFHQGVKTDYAATEKFIRELPGVLGPQSTATIVANDFLQYPALIEGVVGHCEELTHKSGFRVYRASRSG